jgi:hypothetical protein
MKRARKEPNEGLASKTHFLYVNEMQCTTAVLKKCIVQPNTTFTFTKTVFVILGGEIRWFFVFIFAIVLDYHKDYTPLIGSP